MQSATVNKEKSVVTWLKWGISNLTLLFVEIFERHADSRKAVCSPPWFIMTAKPLPLHSKSKIITLSPPPPGYRGNRPVGSSGTIQQRLGWIGYIKPSFVWVAEICHRICEYAGDIWGIRQGIYKYQTRTVSDPDRQCWEGPRPENCLHHFTGSSIPYGSECGWINHLILSEIHEKGEMVDKINDSVRLM